MSDSMFGYWGMSSSVSDSFMEEVGEEIARSNEDRGHRRLLECSMDSMGCTEDKAMYTGGGGSMLMGEKWLMGEKLRTLQEDTARVQTEHAHVSQKGWAEMEEGESVRIVPIYSNVAPYVVDGGVCAEVRTVLAEAFSSCISFNVASSANDVANQILDKSNFEVVKVSRVQNRKCSSMHAHFALMYDIKSMRTVYHGTTETSGISIANRGFRGAASSRARWGMGIYASNNPWEALAYAEPDLKTNKQILLVNDLSQGPTVLGQDGMKDFGSDKDGNDYLTATNPENTIFCASMGSQLLCKYIVEMRYYSERDHTLAHESVVIPYNITVLRRARAATAARNNIQINPIVSIAPRSYIPPVITTVNKYRGFEVGDRVKLQRLCSWYSFCDGKEGTLRKIIHCYRHHYCVELDDMKTDDVLRNRIKHTRFSKEPLKGQDPMHLVVQHVSLLKQRVVGLGVEWMGGQTKIYNTAAPQQKAPFISHGVGGAAAGPPGPSQMPQLGFLAAPPPFEK